MKAKGHPRQPTSANPAADRRYNEKALAPRGEDPCSGAWQKLLTHKS